jgi:putative membrane protein
MRSYFRAIATTTLVGVGLLGWAAMAQDPTPQTGTPKTKSTGKQSPGMTDTQNTGSANRMTMADSSFATKAAAGGMAEVKLGELAKTNASSADVKTFGERMVTDHTKANEQLKQIATTKGITLPTSLNAKDQATYDRLSKLNGAAFDAAYMKDMVADHKVDVNEFKREADKGMDTDLKQFASSTLPTLQEHLQMAESTANKVKGSK